MTDEIIRIITLSLSSWYSY